MKLRTLLILLAGLLALACGGRLAWRAHRCLVTLNVHDLPLRKVISKLRWQTWEAIYADKDVDGKITLNVADQPLEVVLGIINDQVNGRWNAVYPLYTTRKSLAAARSLAKGEVQPPVPGWTNWSMRFWPGRGSDGETGPNGGPPTLADGLSPERRGFRERGTNFGGFGFFGEEQPAAASALVSLKVVRGSAFEAAFEIRRSARARVVPEDGTTCAVTLELEKTPLDKAVAALAGKVDRKWTRFYVFESRRSFRPSRGTQDQLAGEPSPPPDRAPPKRAELVKLLHEVSDPTTRAAALEQMQQEFRGRGFGDGPPGGGRDGQTAPSAEERQKRFQQLAANPQFQQRAADRMVNLLKNTTPEQRANRDLQRLIRQRATQGQPQRN